MIARAAARSSFEPVPFAFADVIEPPPASRLAKAAEPMVQAWQLDGVVQFARAAVGSIAPWTPIPDSDLYVTGAGDARAVAANDVNQNDLGDCYFMAAAAALARANPKAIEDLIRVNHDASGKVASYTVTLWDKQSTWFGLSSKNVRREITVDANFPMNGRGGPGDVDPASGKVEIWPLILEKAYAQMRGGYGEIGKGGQPSSAMFALTGREGTGYAPAQFAGYIAPPSRGGMGGPIPPSVTWDSLKRDFDAGKMITMSSREGEKKNGPRLPYDVVTNHAYAVAGFREVGGVKMVDLQNPWGFDHVSIPYNQLAASFRKINVV